MVNPLYKDAAWRTYRPVVSPLLRLDPGERGATIEVPEIPARLGINSSALQLLRACNGSVTFEGLLERAKDRGGPTKEARHAEVLFQLARLRVISSPLQKYRIQSVDWDLTRQCNLRCKHCYVSAGVPLAGELDLEQNLAILASLYLAGVIQISWSGGEPLCSPQFMPLLRRACELNMYSEIFTNGTLLNRDFVASLAGMKITGLQISLDGATPAAHEFMRGKGTFKKTVQGIRNLVDAKIAPVVVAMTVTDSNRHEIEPLISLCVSLGVDTVTIGGVTNTGRAMANCLSSPWGGNGEEAAIESFHLAKKYKGLIRVKTRTDYLEAEDELLSTRAEESYGCPKVAAGINIRPDGVVAPCRRFGIDAPNLVYGKLPEQSLFQILEHPERRDLKRLRDIAECSRCDIRMDCGGACKLDAYEAYGTMSAPSPRCSEIRRVLGNLRHLMG
jgi:radical SAM protein with 4Fe4S-binding SPASM domain